MRAKLFASVEALQVDLDTWLHHYNHERPHLGYRNLGGRPWEKSSGLSDKEAKRTLETPSTGRTAVRSTQRNPSLPSLHPTMAARAGRRAADNPSGRATLRALTDRPYTGYTKDVGF